MTCRETRPTTTTQHRVCRAPLPLVFAALPLACLVDEGDPWDAMGDEAHLLDEAIDADQEGSALASELEEPLLEDIMPSLPPVAISWPELAGSKPTELPGTSVVALIRNDFEDDMTVELSWLGDLGTTRTYSGELDRITVPAGQAIEFPVDLEAQLPTLSTRYSGRLHLVARIVPAAGERSYNQVVGPSLYFHQSEDTTLVYSEAVLRSDLRAGDFSGLHDETRRLEDANEATIIERVVGFEAEEENALHRAGIETQLEPDAASLSPGTAPEGLTTPAAAASFNHTLCVQFQAQTIDSGYANSKGITEDHWKTANNGLLATAPGVRVKIGTTTYDTNVFGCVTFPSSQSSIVRNIRVYSYVSDVDNNYLRLHNGPSDSTSSYPGSTYSRFHTGVTFSSPQVTVLRVGSYTPRWTSMAAMAYSMFRFHDSVTDTEFHVSDRGGEHPADPSDCNANVNYKNDVVDDESYIRLTSASVCAPPSQRSKFVIAHEYGHAYGQQAGDKATLSPASTAHAATPAGTCEFTGTVPYDNNTKEWSSLAFREGWAHFVASRVWNNRSSDGQLRWGESFDLERWDSGNTAGGYLVNNCCDGTAAQCASSLDGAGTLSDWMRSFWDIHTDSQCPLYKDDMSQLYGDTINKSGLANDKFWIKSAEAFLSAFGASCVPRWLFIGCYNGVAEQGDPWNGC